MTAFDPMLELQRLINGFQVSQAIHVVATLGIADRLSDGARTSNDLAAMTDTHAGALYRLLRALAAVGVFHEDDDRRFSLTSIGECLRTGAARSRGAWARFVMRPPMWQAWSQLLHSVRTGNNAFRSIHGMNVWEFRASNVEEGATFDLAMRETSLLVADAVLAACDFGRFRRIVDVGGGDGGLLARLLQFHPTASGTLFDLPHVACRAGNVLRAAGVDGRCEVSEGSFFDCVPEGGDAYVLKFVLHDWEDEPARAILRACSKAMREGAILLVIERLLAPPNQGADSKLSDLNMLVNAGGCERTRAELADLLHSTGFALTGIVRVVGDLAVVEASRSGDGAVADGLSVSSDKHGTSMARPLSGTS